MSRTAGWLWRVVALAAVLSAVASSSARATGITEFTQGLPAGTNPAAPTAGPDGNVWFADLHGIGRVKAIEVKATQRVDVLVKELDDRDAVIIAEKE